MEGVMTFPRLGSIIIYETPAEDTGCRPWHPYLALTEVGGTVLIRIDRDSTLQARRGIMACA